MVDIAETSTDSPLYGKHSELNVSELILSVSPRLILLGSFHSTKLTYSPSSSFENVPTHTSAKARRLRSYSQSYKIQLQCV